MFKPIAFKKIECSFFDVEMTTDFILRVQKPNGEIPWSIGGRTDPWDHVESAMGLTVGGNFHAAEKAYMWSSKTQMEDGSWWSYYKDGKPQEDAYKDSNMTAYIAVGVFHHYLATGDIQFLQNMWHAVSRAIDYVIALQGDEGEIAWAKRRDGSLDRTALLTGSSSIYLSLSCALQIASLLKKDKPQWKLARMKLGHAIRYKPYVFDQSKSRYSMDWYYPILCGALTGKNAQRRMDHRWDIFAVPDWGIRCVSDQPWVTMAETAELSVTLSAMGNFAEAEKLLAWIQDKKYEDGAFWTGATFPDRIIFTEEKTAWTAAAVLLAADILYSFTSASRLFSHRFWKSATPLF